MACGIEGFSKEFSIKCVCRMTILSECILLQINCPTIRLNWYTQTSSTQHMTVPSLKNVIIKKKKIIIIALVSCCDSQLQT